MKSPTRRERQHDADGSAKHDGAVHVLADRAEEKAHERVTLLACVLGAVASIGGFIFGYVRCGRSSPRPAPRP